MKKPDLVKAAPVFLAAFLSGCATSPQTAQVPDLLQQALARVPEVTRVLRRETG